ncbi:MAG: heme exporter protein CcmB [candidate division Zixibacteria bacterium]|nr:heme exporter protein CcmB [candidate division Zixibacteria bacterium]
MVIRSSSWATKSAWLLAKDLKCEFRTRYALNAILMFALTTLVVVSFSFGASSLSSRLISSLLWLVIFFSSMSGLAQVFVKEEESRTVNVLKLVATPSTVFLGKFLFNLFLLLLLEIVIVPLFIILMNLSILNLWLFLSVLLLGSLGLVCATTIIAAIISKAHVKGALFAVLSFPILLPLLITAIDGTRLSLEGEAFSAGWGDLRLLISYVVVMFVASLLLFDFVWSE